MHKLTYGEAAYIAKDGMTLEQGYVVLEYPRHYSRMSIEDTIEYYGKKLNQVWVSLGYKKLMSIVPDKLSQKIA